MKNLKNIFLLTLILLTSFVFGQVKFKCNSFTYPNTGVSQTVTIFAGNHSVETEAFTANGTFTIDIQKAGTNSVIITNGVTTQTVTTSGTYTFNTNSVTKDSLVFTTESQAIPITGLSVTSTPSATGINDINKSLPLTTYSNLNSIFVKNIQNIDDVKIEVFNLAGQLVFEDKVTKDKFELNVSTGIYIVRLSKDDNFVTKKVFLGE